PLAPPQVPGAQAGSGPTNAAIVLSLSPSGGKREASRPRTVLLSRSEGNPGQRGQRRAVRLLFGHPIHPAADSLRRHRADLREILALYRLAQGLAAGDGRRAAVRPVTRRRHHPALDPEPELDARALPGRSRLAV